MRVLGIADCVFSFGNVDGIIRHHLDVLSVKNAVRFLRHDVGYARLAALEIVAQLLHCVGFAALAHRWLPRDVSERVLRAPGIDRLRLEVIFHIVGGELHIPVCHGNVAVVIDHLSPLAEILDYRVSCGRECRSFERRLAEHLYRICAEYGVREVNGVPDGLDRIRSSLLRAVKHRSRNFCRRLLPTSARASVVLR